MPPTEKFVRNEADGRSANRTLLIYENIWDAVELSSRAHKRNLLASDCKPITWKLLMYHVFICFSFTAKSAVQRFLGMKSGEETPFLMIPHSVLLSSCLGKLFDQFRFASAPSSSLPSTWCLKMDNIEVFFTFV